MIEPSEDLEVGSEIATRDVGQHNNTSKHILS